MNNSIISTSEAVTARSAWPSATDFTCWHCSGAITGVPFPAVRARDFTKDRYSVFGYFCTRACALGYLSEHAATFSPRCAAWTAHLWATLGWWPDDHSGGTDTACRAALPAIALSTYGGPLTRAQWAAMTNSTSAAAGSAERTGACSLTQPPFTMGSLDLRNVEERRAAAAPSNTECGTHANEDVFVPRRSTRNPPLLVKFLREWAGLLIKPPTASTASGDVNATEVSAPPTAGNAVKRLATRRVKATSFSSAARKDTTSLTHPVPNASHDLNSAQVRLERQTTGGAQHEAAASVVRASVPISVSGASTLARLGKRKLQPRQ